MRLKELRGFLDDGTFEEVNLRVISEGTTILNYCFIYKLKKADKGLGLKYRLISQNYCDEGAPSISKKSPTIQRFRRVILSVAASKSNMYLYTRDVTEAIDQSSTKI